MNGRSLQVREWISTRVEIIHGMLYPSRTAEYPWAHRVRPGKPVFVQLCFKVLSERNLAASLRVVSVTSGFSLWFRVRNSPTSVLWERIVMEGPDVLARGPEDAECALCPVQTMLCLASRNLSSRFSFEANAMPQRWKCVHLGLTDDLAFNALRMLWLYHWISLHRLKADPRLTQLKRL